MLQLHLIRKSMMGSSTCQYPIGDPLEEGFHFCGEPTHKQGASYCLHHHNLCYLSGERLRAVMQERKRLKLEMAKEKKSKYTIFDGEE